MLVLYFYSKINSIKIRFYCKINYFFNNINIIRLFNKFVYGKNGAARRPRRFFASYSIILIF
ncbi:MAG: hypothetical protein A2008_01520 [Candidatus Wallbacteria bacterium GWC2_49_35]|uniref:Uncharacterized protein n=1 Tax=Candidatus Wallbacteria bacterium GWC2_49_35 TaxID=1817813 RepID=A0A1F7WGW5_9BACT|nr:MAG: hypothetical protein A2008_01520 [Candidatus Wallbacteria bacterium GWC2_49_35]HBC73898.1 hypothetical protein [Candidatus Wallbacteria bacterium]